MKIKLVCVGSVRDRNVATLVQGYAARATHYFPFAIDELPDVRSTGDSNQQKNAEGQKILARISANDYLVLFDEKGVELTSRKFAGFIEQKSVTMQGNLIFVIGGPYGFSDEVYRRSNMKLSLSQMTFPHELARLVAVEQIYRAATILRGEPYHHD